MAARSGLRRIQSHAAIEKPLVPISTPAAAATTETAASNLLANSAASSNRIADAVRPVCPPATFSTGALAVRAAAHSSKHRSNVTRVVQAVAAPAMPKDLMRAIVSGICTTSSIK